MYALGIVRLTAGGRTAPFTRSLGWNNVGWHNNDMQTPTADELVRDGIELDRHYAFYYCAPTRSSLMVTL